MKIKYKSVLTLDDDNEYVVAGVAKYNNSDYVYLVDIHNHVNMKFAEIENDGSLSIINSNEKELINKLVPLFYDSAKDDLKNIGKIN